MTAKVPSAGTFNRHLEGGAHLSHSLVTQPPESLHEHGDRNALERVEIDCAALRHRVIASFEDDLARQTAYRRRTRRDKGAAQPWDGSVAREHHDGAPTDLRQLAPPQLAPRGKWAVSQDPAAATRNESRSPHASGSPSGCSSYAA